MVVREKDLNGRHSRKKVKRAKLYHKDIPFKEVIEIH